MFLDFISYSGGPLAEDLLEVIKQPVSILWGKPWPKQASQSLHACRFDHGCCPSQQGQQAFAADCLSCMMHMMQCKNVRKLQGQCTSLLEWVGVHTGAEDPWEKVEWGRRLANYPSVEEFVAFPGEQI